MTFSNNTDRTSYDFDLSKSSLLERMVFANRFWIIVICAILTLFFGYQATKLQLNACFEKMIPTKHPYICNYLEYQTELSGLGNALKVVVANKDGDIYDKSYMETLKKINDQLFLTTGVDRAFMRSLWTPATRWLGVTEFGLDGGPVIPDGYDGGDASLQRLKRNVLMANQIGQLVSMDQRSSLVYVPLLSSSSLGKPIDYRKFSKELEKLRAEYESDKIDIHIIGFAKVAGDLLDGLRGILLFFVLAIIITAIVVGCYTRCLRSTLLVVTCSLVGVVWQLGMLPTLGYALDPYSILVPFLIFAIGMSHGSQVMNSVLNEVGCGMPSEIAVRSTLRRLFMTGLIALFTDAIGFGVLMVIEIEIIRELAIAACIGVAVLVVTNLILFPLLLSYVGANEAAALRMTNSCEIKDIFSGLDHHRFWRFLVSLSKPKGALISILIFVSLGIFGLVVSQDKKIGDLDRGAPELRPDSRYNRDNAFLTEHYGASSDIFAIMVKTPDGYCAQYDILRKIDVLEWKLRNLPGVESTHSLALLNRGMLVALTEGSPKWYELQNNQIMLNTITADAPQGVYNSNCNLLTMYVYLEDHKAETLTRVVNFVEDFAAANNTEEVQFILAAGSAGIEAATNIVVKKADRQMLLLVYGVVIILCMISFRSLRATICAVLPLMLTSILCSALMVYLNIGVKVATLPVIALGVGIGVDYALYVMNIILMFRQQGCNLSEAYYRALLTTGKVVILTSITLAVGVSTWYLSPIKFQADMGILLSFMFIFNMIGALLLLPALSCFILRQQDS